MTNIHPGRLDNDHVPLKTDGNDLWKKWKESRPQKEGEKWFLLNKRCWQRINFGSAAEGASDTISRFDNAMLLDEQGQLRTNLVEDSDFVLLPEEVWGCIIERFGCDAGTEICRETIVDSDGARVELFPYVLRIRSFDGDTLETRSFSCREPINDVLKEIHSALELNADVRCRYWRCSNEEEEFSLIDIDSDVQQCLEDVNLVSGDIIAVELPDEDGAWSLEPPSRKPSLNSYKVGDRVDVKNGNGNWVEAEIVQVSSCNSKITVHFVGTESNWDKILHTSLIAPLHSRSQGSDDDPSSVGSTSSLKRKFATGLTLPSTLDDANEAVSSIKRHGQSLRGVRGLQNLGNTCFMASCLQCLNQAEEFSEYFLSGSYVNDINPSNPLGMQGKLARVYGKLINNLWSGEASSIAPFDIKRVLATHAPMFSGYRQHDSQEFLAFLLDGLHEDLNLVTNKPYVEAVERADVSDAVLAAEAWDRHLLRNRSKVVDLFQGQLKSTVVCPSCDRVSITFDPFLFLSLPLTAFGTRAVVITMVFADLARPFVTQTLKVPSSGFIRDLKTAIASEFSIGSSCITLVELWQNKVHQEFKDDERISEIDSSDVIFAYELNTVDSEESVRFIVEHSKSSLSYSSQSNGLAFPRIFILPTDSNVSDLAVSCVEALCRKEYQFDASDLSMSINGRSSSPRDLIVPDSPLLKSDRTVTLTVKWSMKLLEEGFDISRDATQYRHRAAAASDQTLSLEECIKLFTNEEVLGEHDLWYCSKCKEFRRATKKFDLWKLPPLLVVHLKRFQYSTMSRSKLNSLVRFPIDGLDLSPFVIGPHEKGSVYDLFAISNHMGGIGGGHYTAYGKNHIDERWYLFDDSITRPVDPESIQTRSAYVLYYRLRTDASK